MKPAQPQHAPARKESAANHRPQRTVRWSDGSATPVGSGVDESGTKAMGCRQKMNGNQHMVIWQIQTSITVSRISRKGYKLLQKLANLSAIKTHTFWKQVMQQPSVLLVE